MPAVYLGGGSKSSAKEGDHETGSGGSWLSACSNVESVWELWGTV